MKLSQVFRSARAPATTRAVDLDLQLQKRLGNFHLDVAWSPQARRLAIVGPSGSGKSLTLKMIAGIEACDRGSVRLDGRDIASLEPAARGIAYVPQNYGLFPHLTVSEQLAFPAGADPDLAQYWIDRLGLRGLETRQPDALSLGQQQRVALARALVRPARLLLLDEPFSALDAPLRARLRREMLALQSELSATTILVTHDPAEAAMLADEILVFENGRALQAGPTDQVFRRPNNETVARLLGADHAAKGIAVGGDSIAVGADVLLKVSGPLLTPGARVGWTVSPARVAFRRRINRRRRRLRRSTDRQRLPLRYRSRRSADLAVGVRTLPPPLTMDFSAGNMRKLCGGFCGISDTERRRSAGA